MSATQHDYEFRNPSRGAASGYDAGLMYEQIWGIVMGTGFEKYVAFPSFACLSPCR